MTKFKGKPGYSAAHYARLMGLPDLPGQAEARKRYNEVIRPQIDLERDEKYPVITPENVREVLAWQAARIEELERS